MPRRALATHASLVASLAGLGASVASLVDYLAPEPAFCADTGCATVRASAWSHPLGVPMPAIGIAFFAAMTALAFVPRPRLRRALALVGAAGAVTLIALQAFVIGAWCKLCMIADPSALVLAAAVVGGAGTVRPTARRLAFAGATLAAAVLALGALVSSPAAAPISATPEFVTRAQVPGEVTVVELLDFECPFCRKLAPRVSDAIARAGRPVHVVRMMVPLAIHAHAMDAALAWCCADAQGKGDAMAAALFAADPDDLTPAGCEAIAARVGCDLDRYRATLRDPATRDRVDRDLAEARAAGVRYLPTLFVGATQLTGAGATTDQLAALIAKA